MHYTHSSDTSNENYPSGLAVGGEMWVRISNLIFVTKMLWFILSLYDFSGMKLNFLKLGIMLLVKIL